MTRLIPGSKEWYAAGLADAQKQLGAVWEALLDDVAGEYDDPAEAIQRAIHFRQKQLGAVWEALLDNYVGAYEDPAEAVKDVLALRDQQITNLRQSLVESHEREDDMTDLIAGSKEWYAAKLADAQEQLGAVWEALPDDVAGQYDEPAEAIQRAIHFRDTRIAALTDELAERTDAAKVRGFALGRTDILDRIAEALDQIGEPAPEVRGILATLRTDRTWQR